MIGGKLESTNIIIILCLSSKLKIIAMKLFIYILNMDQTPVFFSIESKTTIESTELKTIHMWYSTSNTKQATVAVAMTTSGH